MNNRTTILVKPAKKEAIENFIQEIKSTGIQNMSFTKMAVFGSDLIMKIYAGLSEDEKSSIEDIYDFVEMINKKIIK